MLIPMSHRYYACPYCGQANFGPWLPRTKMVRCACGANVVHTLRSFIAAWWRTVFAAGALLCIMGLVVLYSLDAVPFGSPPANHWTIVIRSVVFGIIGGLLLSPLGSLVGLIVWNRLQEGAAPEDSDAVGEDERS